MSKMEELIYIKGNNFDIAIERLNGSITHTQLQWEEIMSDLN